MSNQKYYVSASKTSVLSKDFNSLLTEFIYGEELELLKRTNSNFIYARSLGDNYKGYVNKCHISNKNLNLKEKVFVNSLRCPVFKNNSIKSKHIDTLFLDTKIDVIDEKNNMIKTQLGWICSKNVNKNKKSIDFSEPRFLANMFLTTPYIWGGKSAFGIDCSGLIQVVLNYFNIECPRDSADQMEYFKNDVSLKNIKENDLVFWEGHVGIMKNKNEIIHANQTCMQTTCNNLTDLIKRYKNKLDLNVLAIKRFI